VAGAERAVNVSKVRTLDHGISVLTGGVYHPRYSIAASAVSIAPRFASAHRSGTTRAMAPAELL